MMFEKVVTVDGGSRRKDCNSGGGKGGRVIVGFADCQGERGAIGWSL